MDANTIQELPPWMSYSTTVLTNDAGDPISTAVTVVTLPLTYYGPSIPLGTDSVWVYGGLTPPAATGTSSTSTTSASTQTSNTPPDTLTIPPPGTTSTLTTSSLPSQTSPAAARKHTSNRNLGAILGGVFGSLLFCLILALLVFRYRRNRRLRAGPRTDFLTPPPERHSQRSSAAESDSGARGPVWVGWSSRTHSSRESSVERSAGEASPRKAGGEADSFLQSSQAAPPRMPEPEPHFGAQFHNVPSGAPEAYYSTKNSAGSTSTDASGYGTVLDSSISRFNATSQWGQILSHPTLSRIIDESPIQDQVAMHDESHSPLLPPPQLNPDHLPHQGLRESLNPAANLYRQDSTESWVDTVFMTARKIRVDEMDRAEVRQVSSPGPSRLLTAPLRWFRRISRGTESPREQTAFSGEAAIAGAEREELGLRPDGLRPDSELSARTANTSGTVYHDAPSMPQTPTLMQPPLAVTNNRYSPVRQMDDTAVESEGPSVRVVKHEQLQHDQQLQIRDEPVLDATNQADLLDFPVPGPASALLSATGDLSSSTFLSNLVGPQVWRESHSSSVGSAPIVIDVLDEEPPSAIRHWRCLAGGPDHRATFGIPPSYVHPMDPTLSEQGSLHSMRSYLSPNSASIVSGSAPASSESSASPRSRARSSGSGASRAASGSISSDGRRKRSDLRDTGFGRVSVGATGTSGLYIPPAPSSPHHSSHNSMS